MVETASIQDRLDLGRSLYLTKENKSIVIILSQRVHDEVAQEFVKLKKLERTEIVWDRVSGYSVIIGRFV